MINTHCLLVLRGTAQAKRFDQTKTRNEIFAGIAQWQCISLVMRRLGVRVRLPAPFLYKEKLVIEAYVQIDGWRCES